MKRIILILTASIVFFGCQSNKNYNPVNAVPDTDIQLNRNELLQNINNIDSFFYEGFEVKIYNPYKNKGSLELKGALHNHSSNSHDSFIPPYDLGEKYRDEGGFDFYALTEHHFTSFNPEVPGIIWIGNSLEDTKIAQHLNIYNLPNGYEYYDLGNNFKELTNYYKSIGGFVCYNHPSWSRRYQSNNKIKNAPDIDFVEVINSSIFSERAFDLLLSQGRNVFGIAADDYHFTKKGDSSFNIAHIIVFAEKKDKESIWKSLLSGNFYMVSKNARMNIKCENGIITVSSNLPSKYEFISYNASNPAKGKIIHSVTSTNMEPVTEASYAIKGTEGYVRVKVTNDDGTALSQAFMILKD